MYIYMAFIHTKSVAQMDKTKKTKWHENNSKYRKEKKNVVLDQTRAKWISEPSEKVDNWLVVERF